MLLPINSTIEADTLPVCLTAHSHIRLMNDSRWPWLILLPRNSDSTELHQLIETQRNGYLQDITRVSEIIQHHTQCRSVNVAMLGNVVSALHCHVVARDEGDPNWPKPIWGFEQSIAYADDIPEQLIKVVQKQLVAGIQ